MIFESFSAGTSIIHRLDPAVRLAAALILSVSMALCRDFLVLFVFFTLSAGLVAAAGLSAGKVVRALKPLVWLLIMAWLFLPLTFDKTSALVLAGVRLSVPGMETAGLISLKSVSIMLVFISLAATMTITGMGHGLHRLRVPDKLIFLLLMSYRYIDVIRDEYQRLLRAAKFRGFTPGTSLHAYQTFAHLAGMLFVRASLRAGRVYQAMRCRGFVNRFYTLDRYEKSRSNPLFLTLVCTACAGLAAMDVFWRFS